MTYLNIYEFGIKAFQKSITLEFKFKFKSKFKFKYSNTTLVIDSQTKLNNVYRIRIVTQSLPNLIEIVQWNSWGQ